MEKVKVNDGGPAFPKPIGNNGAANYADREVSSEEIGMSLRDYFAAHAPVESQNWFAPVMPTPKPRAEWHEGHGEEGHYCEEFPLNYQERDAWDREREKQRQIQWPYAYADAMLIERAKAI